MATQCIQNAQTLNLLNLVSKEAPKYTPSKHARRERRSPRSLHRLILFQSVLATIMLTLTRQVAQRGFRTSVHHRNPSHCANAVPQGYTARNKFGALRTTSGSLFSSQKLQYPLSATSTNSKHSVFVNLMVRTYTTVASSSAEGEDLYDQYSDFLRLWKSLSQNQ